MYNSYAHLCSCCAKILTYVSTPYLKGQILFPKNATVPSWYVICHTYQIRITRSTLSQGMTDEDVRCQPQKWAGIPYSTCPFLYSIKVRGGEESLFRENVKPWNTCLEHKSCRHICLVWAHHDQCIYLYWVWVG